MLGDAAAAAPYARDCARLLEHIDGMQKPVVAALNDMVLGGGLELVLRCHGIVAQRGIRAATARDQQRLCRASAPWSCPIAAGPMPPTCSTT